MKNPSYVIFNITRQILTCQLIAVQMKQAVKMEKQFVKKFI